MSTKVINPIHKSIKARGIIEISIMINLRNLIIVFVGYGIYLLGITP